MQQIIGLKEFKKTPDFFAQKVIQGFSFIVVKQSKPMFRIISPIIPDFLDVPEGSLDEEDGRNWKTLIDFTKIKKEGMPIEEVVKNTDILKSYGQNKKSHSKVTRKI